VTDGEGLAIDAAGKAAKRDNAHNEGRSFIMKGGRKTGGDGRKFKCLVRKWERANGRKRRVRTVQMGFSRVSVGQLTSEGRSFRSRDEIEWVNLAANKFTMLSFLENHESRRSFVPMGQPS
jgi:hypothetical protein